MPKKLFSQLQKDLEKSDSKREKIIKTSRDALKQSKKAIYALHRGDIKGAKILLDSAAKTLKTVNALAKGDAVLETVGALGEAREEYVEASLYSAFIQNMEFPSAEYLNVRTPQYLGGLCDLSGELVRAAINAAIKEEYAETIRIKDTVARIYSELMMFDFRNSPLRRKFDSIKYGLEKLEDLMLDLKLRDKI
jgi:predicted translin family RNA/ssDNA-binding protein